jgi:hypothetical protein
VSHVLSFRCHIDNESGAPFTVAPTFLGSSRPSIQISRHCCWNGYSTTIRSGVVANAISMIEYLSARGNPNGSQVLTTGSFVPAGLYFWRLLLALNSFWPKGVIEGTSPGLESGTLPQSAAPPKTSPKPPAPKSTAKHRIAKRWGLPDENLFTHSSQEK